MAAWGRAERATGREPMVLTTIKAGRSHESKSGGERGRPELRIYRNGETIAYREGWDCGAEISAGSGDAGTTLLEVHRVPAMD